MCGLAFDGVRTVTAKTAAKTVWLTRREAQAFKIILNYRSLGGVRRHVLIERMALPGRHADRNVSALVVRLRNKLEPLGYTVTMAWWGGEYRIEKIAENRYKSAAKQPVTQ
jgi:hypothetical protein